jgi:hypothetical protein
MNTPELVQVTAVVPRDLKRVAFAKLALNGRKFTDWLREELTRYSHETTDLEEDAYASQPQEGHLHASN